MYHGSCGGNPVFGNLGIITIGGVTTGTGITTSTAFTYVQRAGLLLT